MACNQPRWNWLIQGTYNGLSPHDRENVMSRFFARADADSRMLTEEDAGTLYEVMTELGIKIKGTDPNPPPKPPQITQAGAEEYDQIMLDLESIGL